MGVTDLIPALKTISKLRSKGDQNNKIIVYVGSGVLVDVIITSRFAASPHKKHDVATMAATTTLTATATIEKQRALK